MRREVVFEACLLRKTQHALKHGGDPLAECDALVVNQAKGVLSIEPPHENIEEAVARFLALGRALGKNGSVDALGEIAEDADLAVIVGADRSERHAGRLRHIGESDFAEAALSQQVHQRVNDGVARARRG